MTISINRSDGLQTNTETAVALKTAHLAKNQQERVGEMALSLIASANINASIMPSTSVGNIGHNINIKV